MSFTTLGYVGTALVAIAYGLQIRQLIKEKQASGISLASWLLWLISAVFVLSYAVSRRDLVVAIVQCINIAAMIVTILLTMKFRNKK